MEVPIMTYAYFVYLLSLVDLELKYTCFLLCMYRYISACIYASRRSTSRYQRLRDQTDIHTPRMSLRILDANTVS